MKSIFFIGALLMCGAGIYGFADYQKTKNRQSFKSNHQKNQVGTKETTTPVQEEKIAEVKKESVMPVVENKTPEIVKEKIKLSKSKKLIVSPGKTESKKGKSINYKMFSRAPLKEEYLKASEPVKEKKVTKEEKQ